LQRFLTDEREDTFRCKIVILGGSEIANREVEKCKSATRKIFSSHNFSVSVNRNEKLRRLNYLFYNVVETGRKH